MDLDDISDTLKEKISAVASQSAPQGPQWQIVKTILNGWDGARKTSLTTPYPEPDRLVFVKFDSNSYVEISWTGKAIFYVEESMCIIYTVDARNVLSPPMYFRFDSSEPKDAGALAMAILHVIRHIDLFRWQNNYKF